MKAPDKTTKPDGNGWVWCLMRDVRGHGESFYAWMKKDSICPGYYIANQQTVFPV